MFDSGLQQLFGCAAVSLVLFYDRQIITDAAQIAGNPIIFVLGMQTLEQPFRFHKMFLGIGQSFRVQVHLAEVVQPAGQVDTKLHNRRTLFLEPLQLLDGFLKQMPRFFQVAGRQRAGTQRQASQGEIVHGRQVAGFF